MNIQNIPSNQEYTNFVLTMIHNDNTLNIFSDASMRTREKCILDSCYGSVAVCKDNMVDEWFRIQSNCTVPAAEIRGVRCSLTLAHKWKYHFKNINIFSDSQLAIFGLRDYIYNWQYNPADNKLYNGLKGNKKPVKNQEVYIECLQMLDSLRMNGNIVTLYYQKGHVDNGMQSVKDALLVFKKSNGIMGKIDYNTIRYISLYNNYVDSKSRSIINRTNIFDNVYYDPVSFYATSNLPTTIKVQ